MSTVAKCDICNEVCIPKAGHKLKADDDRFFIDIVMGADPDLDTCPSCWWMLVRQAVKESS